MLTIKSFHAARQALTLFDSETIANICFTELKQQIIKSLQNDINVNDEHINLLSQLATEVYKEKVEFIVQDYRLGHFRKGKFYQCYGLI